MELCKLMGGKQIDSSFKYEYEWHILRAVEVLV